MPWPPTLHRLDDARRNRHPAPRRGEPPPHVRDHLAPRRRQDDAHREAAALRRRDRAGRRRPRPEDRSATPSPTGWTSSASAASRSPRRRSTSSSRSCHITLLDTPGHQDFSEDTYRTLYAVDSAVMVIDAAKGIETQTRKLFEVCPPAPPAAHHLRQQARPARPRSVRPAATRSRTCSASTRRRVNWPIGSGDRFRGVFDLDDRRRRGSTSRCRGRLPRAGAHHQRVAIRSSSSCSARALHATLVDDTALIAGAGTPFDTGRVPGRPADAGVLRQRARQLRPRAVPRRARDAGAAAAAARGRGRRA